MRVRELELYIHIPFCVKKCAYCDFLSAPADKETVQEYVQALLREIRARGMEHGKDRCVRTIFIGGGTPSLLTADQMESIFQVLSRSFHIEDKAEITIEINPGTVTEEKINVWKSCGVNRLSIGLQSANNQELKSLGRIHTWEEFLETFQMVRVAGFQNLNVDLISAIPGQDENSWKNTLKQVIALQPEHISAYSLIVEKGTPFYELYGEERLDSSVLKLPDEDMERRMYDLTTELLSAYGYQRYEISNYSKEGYECNHNKGYWERMDYLGLGVGASSLMNNTRYRNTREYQNYIRGVNEQLDIKEEIEVLSLEDQMEEFLFLGLREMKGISIENFENLFGQSIFEVYQDTLKKLQRDKLIELQNGNMFLTKRGIDLSNRVFVEFLNH